MDDNTTILELRFEGDNVNPSTIKPSEVAELITSFESVLLSTIKQLHPEIDTTSLLFTFQSIENKSLGLGFALKITPQISIEAYDFISEKIKKNTFEALNNDAIEALKEIAKFSKSHNCIGHFNKNGKSLSEITPSTDIQIPKQSQVKGETIIYGTVLKVGGEKPTVHFKVDNEYRIIFLASAKLVKRLASKLYEEVGLKGTAKWNTTTHQVFDFSADGIVELEIKPVNETFNELRELIGEYWDQSNETESVLD